MDPCCGKLFTKQEPSICAGNDSTPNAASFNSGPQAKQKDRPAFLRIDPQVRGVGVLTQRVYIRYHYGIRP